MACADVARAKTKAARAINLSILSPLLRIKLAKAMAYRNDGRNISGPKYGVNHISGHCRAIDLGAIDVTG